MLKAFEFCITTRGTEVPGRPEWLHEIKYDGYRIRVERERDRVRLFSRNGHDWTDRYPWIVEAALKNRIKQFVIDGEAVVLGVDGIPDFNALHSRKHACNMGLEGLVSKRVDRPYRGGRSPDWVKVKNRKHPAMERVKDAFA